MYSSVFSVDRVYHLEDGGGGWVLQTAPSTVTLNLEYRELCSYLILILPLLQQPQLDQEDRRKNAIDILRATSHAGRRTNSSPTDWGVWCPHLAQATRVMKYDYPQVAGAVMGEERVQEALETVAKESVNEKRQELLDAGQSDESFDEDACYNETMRIQAKRAQKVSHVNIRHRTSRVTIHFTILIFTFGGCS